MACMPSSCRHCGPKSAHVALMCSTVPWSFAETSWSLSKTMIFSASWGYRLNRRRVDSITSEGLSPCGHTIRYNSCCWTSTMTMSAVASVHSMTPRRLTSADLLTFRRHPWSSTRDAGRLLQRARNPKATQVQAVFSGQSSSNEQIRSRGRLLACAGSFWTSWRHPSSWWDSWWGHRTHPGDLHCSILPPALQSTGNPPHSRIQGRFGQWQDYTGDCVYLPADEGAWLPLYQRVHDRMHPTHAGVFVPLQNVLFLCN